MSTDFPTRLADKLRAVLDDPLVLEDLEEQAQAVAQLSPQGFVRVARRLERERRLDLLLPHATPEQLTSLLDLDAWDGDRVDLKQTRRWLVAIADAYRRVRPRGALADLIYEMDPEMWTFAALAGTHVIDLDQADDAARDDAHEALNHLRTWETPDGFFVIGVTDNQLGGMVLSLLDHVYADDLAEGRKLALSIQTGIASQIEEDLYRWRCGRLADLGFVEWEEAMRLFRPLDSQAAAQQGARNFAYLSDGTLPDVISWTGPESMRIVMGRLDDAEHGLRAREFLLLVNEVMAAQKFPPGDERLQERAVYQTQATISLGLELLAATQPEHPDREGFLAERIKSIGLRDVFRVGYGALDKLRSAAVLLGRESRISLTAPGSLLDRPWGPAFASIARWYPELPIAGTTAQTRPISAIQDVAAATILLAQSGALATLAFAPAGYDIDPVWLARLDEPERITLGDLIRTAIVLAAARGEEQALVPLAPDDLAWAQKNLVSSGKLDPNIARDFSRRCDALGIGGHTQALAETILTRLRIELLGLELADGQVDLTKVGGFLTVQQVGMWLRVNTGVA